MPRKKITKLGASLLRAANELVAHAKGEIALPVRYIPIADVDVGAIRGKLGLSQNEFARRFCINPRALQDWEQGRRKPESAVRAYLTVIEQNPAVVEKALKVSSLD
jgi:putative transcriptional regulator